MPASALPRLTQASLPLIRSVMATNERGQRIAVTVPVERALTLYLDRAEVVTLMTLGAHPEWLVLGYLLNQRMVESVAEVESVTVDWETGAAAVRTHRVSRHSTPRDASRVVTTGCGQGSMFSDLIDTLAPVPDTPAGVSQETLLAITDTIRRRDTLYKQAGSVHACALFDNHRLCLFVEDVGRHNALDSIAGWRALQPPPSDPGERCPVLYTTGRLTSEMIIKSAQMQVPVVISRSGTTEMAIEVAQRYGVCAIGRALNQRFTCYTHPSRIRFSKPTEPVRHPIPEIPQ
jgi:FdhD protein